MKYLTGCAKLFRVGYIDVNQFTLVKRRTKTNQDSLCLVVTEDRPG